MDLLALHRVRSRLVSWRTGVDQLDRGFLIDRPVTVWQRQAPLRKALQDIRAPPQYRSLRGWCASLST